MGSLPPESISCQTSDFDAASYALGFVSCVLVFLALHHLFRD
jgi:hypothetical protein